MIALIVIGVVAMLLLAGALLLFSKAQTNEKSEEIQSRLVVGGVDEAKVSTLIVDVKNPLVRGICRLFWRTGSEIQPKTVTQSLIALVALIAIIGLATNFIVAIGAVGLVVLLFYIVLAQRASRRRIKIIDQLPAFLENVIRVLTAGNTFEESLIQASRESPEPIRPLFASVSRQVRLGAPLEAVLAEAGDIYMIRDLKVMSLATSINRKYGGSMRSVLKSLVTAIRQRGTAAKELRALTAETRFSAYTLASITLGMFVFLFLSNRNYYDSMLESRGGTIMLGVSAGMILMGFVVLWRMIKSIDEAD